MDTTNLGADIAVWTAGSRNNPFFDQYPETFLLSPKGRVVVNEHLEAAHNIHVIGDNAATPYTGMAQTALHNAAYISQHLIYQNAGRQSTCPINRCRRLRLVPIGPRWAVVQSGDRVTAGSGAG